MKMPQAQAPAPDRGRLRRVMTWRTKRLNPHKHPARDKVRSFGLSLLLNLALHLGVVVVVIGPCRSGKTYLLQQVLPGKIIDRSEHWRESGERPFFNLTKLPEGHFAVDEVSAFEPRSLFDGVLALAQNGRRFALAAQHISQLDEANIGRALMGRRVLVVSLEPSR